MNSKLTSKWLARTMIYLFVIAGACVTAIPFLWMVSSSLKPLQEIFRFPPTFFPRVIRWQNYPEALTSSYVSFWVYLGNSIKLCLPIAVLDVFASALVAFGFARIRFRGSKILFFILLGTMMLPQQVTMIPLYIIFSRLGWVNTYLPIIVPAFFGWPWAIFLLRQFFATIPDDLDDAARIDGCSLPRMFFRIHLPLAKPALGIVAIFSFQGMWAEVFRPLLYLRDVELWPLALALTTYRGRMNRWDYVMVMSVIMCVFPLLLFFVAQRRYIQGIVITGVKG